MVLCGEVGDVVKEVICEVGGIGDEDAIEFRGGIVVWNGMTS